jgi:carbon storage regulator
MLVVSRKQGEKIRVGDNIFITIVRIKPKAVRVGIEAPQDIPVVRTELDAHGDDTESTSEEKSIEIHPKRKTTARRVSRSRLRTKLPVKRKR